MSGSVATPAHVSAVLVLTFVFGVIETDEMIGRLFVIVVLVDRLLVPLYPSVAVARQMTVSPGCHVVLFNVMLGPVEILVLLEPRTRRHA